MAKRAVLFTIGYQGKKIDEYLEALTQEEIQILCDVRRNPISRKPGFSKSKLRENCQKAGLEYRHLPRLGIASKDRRGLKSKADYDKLFKNYEEVTLRDAADDLRQLEELLQSNDRVAITCFEAHAEECHRCRIAHKLVENKQEELEVRNL